MQTKQLGQAAEALAVQHLQQKGFSIVAQNYRYQRAEIDIIAQRKGLIVFVEVKARSSNQFGYPENFVTPKQQALIHTAAEAYIIHENWEESIRFDIIAVEKTARTTKIVHLEDAF